MSLAVSGFEMLDMRDVPDWPGREFVFIVRSSIAYMYMNILTESIARLDR